MHSRPALLAFAASVGAACSACSPAAAPVAASDQPIVGGTVSADDPAVVLILGAKPGAPIATLCTGEVVSPHVVLTAAHCVSPALVGDGVIFQVFTAADYSAGDAPHFVAVREV